MQIHIYYYKLTTLISYNQSSNLKSQLVVGRAITNRFAFYFLKIKSILEMSDGGEESLVGISDSHTDDNTSKLYSKNLYLQHLINILKDRNNTLNDKINLIKSSLPEPLNRTFSSIENLQLKKKYITYDEDIPEYRGIIHGVTSPIFLILGYPIISANYLVSFFYHRVPINEETAKFLDHLIVALRVLSFPEAIPSKFWYRYRLLLIPIILYLLFHQFKDKYNIKDIEYYNFIQKSMVFFSLLVAFTTKNSKIRIAGLIYIIPCLVFYFKVKNLPWHGKCWSQHDDFHFLLFIVDLYMCLYYKPEQFLIKN